MSRGPRVAAAALLGAVLVGCTDPVPFSDLIGLWVAGDGVEQPDGPLTLTVDYVERDGGGCWSAVGPDGLLPVRWPDGTVAGIEPVLELPGGAVVGEGTKLTGTGGHRAAEDALDGAPVGCALDGGFYDVATVDPTVQPGG